MKKAYLSIILVCLMLSFPFAFNKAVAAVETTLNVVPDKVQGLGIGQKFNISVTVGDVVNMFSWQAKILFNATVLKCTKADYSVTGGIFAGHSIVPVSAVIDNTVGSVLHGCSLSGDDMVSGSGGLFYMTFEVLAIGESGLNFSRPYGGDTFLWDNNLNEIPVTMHEGFFTNIPTPRRDVAVTGLDLSNKFPKQGENITMTVTVLNNGTKTETFDVSVFCDSDLIGMKTVTSLAPSEDTILSFEWNTTSASIGAHTIKAEASTVPDEIDTANNVMTVPITILSATGLNTDLNGDGFVDMKDVAFVGRAFGEAEGKPRWEPKADLNHDGVINLMDVVMVCRDFGKRSA